MTTQLLTIGEIARRLKQPVHRVRYIVESRNIEAAGRVGNTRVYLENTVQQIANHMQRPGGRTIGQIADNLNA